VHIYYWILYLLFYIIQLNPSLSIYYIQNIPVNVGLMIDSMGKNGIKE